jgi:hypothetical protein
MRKCAGLGVALLLNLGTLSSARAYDRANYRKGELIHVWPQHGVWQLGLRSGGQSGEDDCVIWTFAGAQTPTLYLEFIFDGGAFSVGKTLNFSDGGMMTTQLLDTNFLAENDENMNNSTNFQDRSDVKISVDGWQFFERSVIRHLVTVNGLKWAATLSPVGVAWDMPNPGDPFPISTLTILDHMRAGKELVMQSWLMTHHIPLAGFGAVLDEFSQCTDMQQDATQ